MNECVLDKIHMIKDIRKALDRDEFLLFFQPKMKIKSGNMTGLEALILWDRGERGIISPAESIPFAEEYNLISFITDWVINEECRH